MKTYIETYGCRMNLCDSEVIVSILEANDYQYTPNMEEADVVVLNCCSVREVGHTKIYQRISELKEILKSEVILCLAGCMSTQLKEDLFDIYPRVHIIICPTAYKELPEALARIRNGQARHLYVSGIKPDEVYDSILPTRVLEDKVTAAVTIMKGCDQYCSYCIEPYTRGERTNRSYEGIMSEIAEIRQDGYQEITLFGHIVDLWQGEKHGVSIGFAQLLDDIAKACPQQRIKYISSHPLTFSDDIVRVVKQNDNIMRVVHLPVQSGSDKILHRMNRRYTSKQFLQRVEEVRRLIPSLQIITDVMVGFPGEEDEDFLLTLDLLRHLQCANANIFTFSMRSGTMAYKNFEDKVSDEVKKERARITRNLVNQIRAEQLNALIGTTQTVIAEREEKDYWYGRDIYHRTIAFPPLHGMKIGQKFNVTIRQIKDNQVFGTIYDENTYREHRLF